MCACLTGFLVWVKKNLLVVLLLLVIVFLLARSKNPTLTARLSGSSPAVPVANKMVSEAGRGGVTADMAYPVPAQEAAPAPEAAERLVVKNSQMSLKVTDVVGNIKKITDKASGLGGYMVNSNVAKPEETTSGNVTVRVPADKLDEFLDFCRSLAVKVVSENIQGRDVTDQYVDTQKRVETLEKTKAKFEEILGKASQVNEIMQVQQQIIYLQDQIDNLKGQNNYLEQTAKISRVTIYLTSDELELPYAPTQAWRPNVVFKTAVRQLILTVRSLGTLAIWLGVFSVVWGPVLVGVLIWKRRKPR